MYDYGVVFLLLGMLSCLLWCGWLVGFCGGGVGGSVCVVGDSISICNVFCVWVSGVYIIWVKDDLVCFFICVICVIGRFGGYILFMLLVVSRLFFWMLVLVRV